MVKTEVCGICKQNIYLNKDNYCRLTDYRSGKFYMDGFYHTQCYTDRLKGKSQAEMDLMKKAAMNLMFRTNKMLKEVGV